MWWYSVTSLVAVVAVLVAETRWLRTGLLTRRRYWVTMAIVFGFQVPVDGWLTKLDDPIVLYNPQRFSGIRFPWDIPIEDFAFGWAMVTTALLGWVRAGSAVPPTTSPRR